jgi:L-ascorbate metabolism protein UlaG (beta-lactamase superfamily)
MRKRIFKAIKKIMIVFGIILGVLVLIVVLFVNLSPEFGGKATKEQQAAYATSENYKDGIFNNIGNVTMDMSRGDMFKAMKGMLSANSNTKPSENIEVQKIDSLDIVNYKNKTRLIWFGHSAFLLQMNNKNILIDPMFGDVPAPHPLLGVKRFSKELPIAIEKIPEIDAVLISHDHYDHLDYGSILKLKEKVNAFYVPLGVGAHLIAWGVDAAKITELDWWEEAIVDDLVFRAAPAQHFSGRGVSDRAKTLWCSWILKSPTENIFFSGDSGYAEHFKEIGVKYGPFDFAMLECGQYNKLWPVVHMFPEETVQAGADLNAKTIMPIHWGAFKLAQHSWIDPVERVSKKAKELGIDLITPVIGEPIELQNLETVGSNWWKN